MTRHDALDHYPRAIPCHVMPFVTLQRKPYLGNQRPLYSQRVQQYGLLVKLIQGYKTCCYASIELVQSLRLCSPSSHLE